ncbi:MAG TPA: hypothetical protein VE135_16230 [Pyrinomonadaceae bacterium]|nr:hypothetical protein [Pyrinomonadaceae bacterium]
MNKDTAIERFVKDEYELLLSNNYTVQKLRKSFSDRYGNQFGRIDSRDVVEPLVVHLSKHDISPENIEKYVETLPVFRGLTRAVERKLVALARKTDHTSGLKPEDKEIIRQLDALEAAKRIHSKQLESHASRELEKYHQRIEEVRLELERLPSILDEANIEEPIFDPAQEETQQWWERFYLKANPFPLREGLQEIDEDLYDEVIVKTKPFREVIDALNKNPKHLFHAGFLLAGDYGYGKTTFIDYLSYHLIHRNIVPILVTPSPKPFPDTGSYANDFHLTLRDKLRDELISISNENLSEVWHLDVIRQLKELMRRIQEHRREGIVVFLDDYHKHTSTYDYIFEFLGLQQLLKNDLMRAHLNVGFIVSGLPNWLIEVSRSEHLRGFLDNTPITMPEITPELVCDVFNQRIKALCFDETPRKIKPQFVVRLFKELNANQGYRYYLNAIVTQLSNNNFSIIDTPVEIEPQTLAKVRAELERDEAVRQSLHKLIHGSRFKSFTKEQVAKSLGLLIQTSLHGGITEVDRLFEENKFYFNLLREADLIQRRRKPSSDPVASFEWVIHSKLQEALDRVREHYKLGMNDYLLKLYAAKDYSPQPLTSVESSELLEVKRFFSREDLRLEKSELDSIETALRLFDGVLLADRSLPPKHDDINRGWTAFSYLSSALFEIDDSKRLFTEAGISDLKDQWYFHSVDDEVLTELLNRFDQYSSKKEIKVSGTLVLKQLEQVFPIIAQKLKTIIEDISDNTFHGLFTRNTQHSAEELGIFEQVRVAFASAINVDHYSYVKRITDYLELRLRLFLYATSVLAFGEHYDRVIPRGVHKYSKQNLESRLNSYQFHNEFNGLTRAQLQEIFLSGNEIKTMVGQHLNCGWTEADWKTFFKTFLVENIRTGHQQVQAFSHTDKTQYMNYCRRAEELTAAVNAFVRNILKLNSYLIHCGGDEFDPSNYFFRFVFGDKKALVDKVHSGEKVPSLLTSGAELGMLGPKTYESVITTLGHKIEGAIRHCLVEDLLEVEYITNNYNVSYVDFLHSLAFAYRVDKKIVVQPWFGSSILIREAARSPTR